MRKNMLIVLGGLFIIGLLVFVNAQQNPDPLLEILNDEGSVAASGMEVYSYSFVDARYTDMMIMHPVEDGEIGEEFSIVIEGPDFVGPEVDVDFFYSLATEEVFQPLTATLVENAVYDALSYSVVAPAAMVDGQEYIIKAVFLAQNAQGTFETVGEDSKTVTLNSLHIEDILLMPHGGGGGGGAPPQSPPVTPFCGCAPPMELVYGTTEGGNGVATTEFQNAPVLASGALGGTAKADETGKLMVGYAFQVIANLQEGSKADLCEEGQTVQDTLTVTASDGSTKEYKPYEFEGTKGGKREKIQFKLGGKNGPTTTTRIVETTKVDAVKQELQKQGYTDVTATDFPYGGTGYADDGYHAPNPQIFKVHGGNIITWLDVVGMRGPTGSFSGSWKFKHYVNGKNGGSSCTCETDLKYTATKSGSDYSLSGIALTTDCKNHGVQ